MKTATNWTYGGYWASVLGLGNATKIVDDYGLVPSDRQGMSEWLGAAEEAALSAASIDNPDEWADFHTRALDELCSVDA